MARQEKWVYRIPVTNGVYWISPIQEPDEVFTLRADGTYITNKRHPELEEADIPCEPWDEGSMRVISSEKPEDAVEPVSEGYVCPKCGKVYKSEDWCNKHIAKCEG